MQYKMETIEEYMARGGRIHHIQREDIKPRSDLYNRTRMNIPKEERAQFVANRAKLKKAAEVKCG